MAEEIQQLTANFQAVNEQAIPKALEVIDQGNLKVEASAMKAKKATEEQAKAEHGLVGSLRSGSEALDKNLQSTEALFKGTDRIMALIGKATGVIGLAVLAWEAYKKVQELVKGSSHELTGEIERQVNTLKDQAVFLASLRGAGGEIAAAAGVPEAALTPEEIEQARTIRYEREQALQKQADLLGRVEAAQIRVNRLKAERPGESVVSGELEAARNELNILDFQITGLGLQRDKLISDVRARELGGKARTSGKGGGRKVDPLADVPQLVAEADAFKAFLDELVAEESEGQSLFEVFTGLKDAVASELEVQFIAATAAGEQFIAMLAAAKTAADEAMAPVTAFAENLGRSFLAAAVDAAIFGASLEQTLNAIGKGALREAAIQVPIELARYFAALGQAPFYPPAAAAAQAHLVSAGIYAAIGVGGAGLAAATGGIRGGVGGGGGTSPAPSAADLTPPGRREQQGAGGPLNLTVYIDGMTVSTAADIAHNVLGAMEYARETPGMANRFDRAVRTRDAA